MDRNYGSLLLLLPPPHLLADDPACLLKEKRDPLIPDFSTPPSTPCVFSSTPISCGQGQAWIPPCCPAHGPPPSCTFIPPLSLCVCRGSRQCTPANLLNLSNFSRVLQPLLSVFPSHQASLKGPSPFASLFVHHYPALTPPLPSCPELTLAQW